MAGKGAGKRANVKRAQQKQALKKATKARLKFEASLPKVSEDDLVAFQLQHFGDDTAPENWFIDKETAVQGPPLDDDLGSYEDGIQRTLTDEQIAIFRRTELWQMKQEQKLEREDDEDERAKRAMSPVSDVSSLEDDLLAYATVKRRIHLSPPKQLARRLSSNSRSDTTVSSAARKRPREEEVPYDQRHKRKWEAYVGHVDPEHGSLTQRRMAREQDDQQAEPVDLNY
ncbi:hypothetical protein DOTSEDRAFT_44556 [Dothistroma septosporum NZE10]|uniref:Uncharacterized protein n=1 Tax=Dothistroma septosporum (strain NZE10 / CBS 128990) TaxID=675120 RepID=N1PPJ0_DOTSN|nr:hypothetical protein DOTSEDRAFT_44556 [Dothistroma septosporum NZE10]